MDLKISNYGELWFKNFQNSLGQGVSQTLTLTPHPPLRILGKSKGKDVAITDNQRDDLALTGTTSTTHTHTNSHNSKYTSLQA
jgi:hypothetical protein